MADIGYLRHEAAAARGADAADLMVRSILLLAVFLLLWISIHPFPDLSVATEVTETGNLVNQAAYTLTFVVLAAWCLKHHPERLLLLLRPILVITMLWIAVTVAMSWEPALSARRFAFMLVTTGIGAMVLLLPKDPRHFAGVLAAAVLIVLVLCYLGVLLAPQFSVHQATDYLEPELAGDWRGVFSHKNEASAVMAAFIFFGIFIGRSCNIALGALIVGLALPFLIFTHSKTVMGMLPLALAVTAVMARIRRPMVGIGLALSVLIFFNVLSVGSLYFAPIQNLTAALLSDPTFTGRTEVWTFALDNAVQRPLFGYGFAAFWGTPEVVYGMAANQDWANNAAYAHNAFIDLVLTLGLPGLVLVTLWLVVLPLVDFYRVPSAPATAPLRMLFVQISLFAAYDSCFENSLLGTGSLSVLVMMATFGLRFLATAKVAR